MATFSPRTRAAWRLWLKKNHAKKREVWLLSYKKHTGKPSLPFQDALEEALCFGWIDTKVRRVNDDRYVTRYTPRQPKSQWSTTNVNLYRKLERAGLMTAAGRTAFRAKSRVYTPVLVKHRQTR